MSEVNVAIRLGAVLWLAAPSLGFALALEQASQSAGALLQAQKAAPARPALAPFSGKAGAPAVLHAVVDKSKLTFDDGDTVYVELSAESGILDKDGRPFSGELRLLGYDTPETLHPEHGIFYHQPFGPEASALAKKLIEAATTVEVYTAGQPDKYGRLLSYLVLDGKPLAVSQIEAGLAYETVSFYGDNGFPAFAAEVTDAWSRSPIRRAIDGGQEPAFVNPHIWRKLHQDFETRIERDRWNAMRPEEREAVVETARKRAEARAREPGQKPR